MMEEDAALVQRSISGDSSAFGVLYDRYALVIRAICFEMTGDSTRALELSQEVFLRGFARLPSLRKGDRFGPWLVSIARYVCREWRRGRQRDRHEFMVDPPEPAIHAADEPSETVSQLRVAIARLPEQERLALHLFYVTGESAEASREMLRLSRSGFYKVLTRAKERLARMLRNEEEAV
jgi:RNA polymerase sigma-70 factor (ECF subfamily)